MQFPDFALVRQEIPAPRVERVKESLLHQLFALNLAQGITPGQSVAITAGSRGVTDMPLVLRALVEWCKSLGARPYISPAMGSHGGATDEGQLKVLAELGVSEAAMGAPIRSSMQAEPLAQSSFGGPVYMGHDFSRADHVVLVNRIKAHTSFKGQVASGLMKIMAVGMGKHLGAEAAHHMFYQHGFEAVVREYAAVVLAKLPILCGVALVENRLEQTAELAVIKPDEIQAREPELLSLADSLLAKVPFEGIHLLIVDEMGKNLSGGGMDSNVTGRFMNQVTPDPPGRQFRRIFVRDLTPQSGGNALGVGAADVTVQRLVAKIDPKKTRINCVTAMVPEKGRVPLTYDNDREAMKDALSAAGARDLKKARMVWIKNTLELECMRISRSLEAEARQLKGVRFLSDFQPLPFDANGDLPFGLISAQDGK